MNNQELYDAIAFTWQSAENANKGYSVANNDRARLMYDHLKELLSVQLDRAKNESSDRVPRQRIVVNRRSTETRQGQLWCDSLG